MMQSSTYKVMTAPVVDEQQSLDDSIHEQMDFEF